MNVAVPPAPRLGRVLIGGAGVQTGRRWLPKGRAGLAGIVGAPASERAIRLHPAAVRAAGADRGEGAGRWAGLAEGVAAPAVQRAVRPLPAAVCTAGGGGAEGARGRGTRLAGE